jgi:uncharacterized coiled-coil protein SlyX
MIKKLTDAEKAQMHDQLWRTIAKNQETITEQGTLIAQLSDELAAMTKTLDKACDMLELMTKTATENREAYEAETLSTLEMAKRITQLEGDRDRVIARINRLANAASVLWEEHKAFGEDMHDTEGVDYMGTDSEGHRMMQELVDEMLIIDCRCLIELESDRGGDTCTLCGKLFKSQREAAETASDLAKCPDCHKTHRPAYHDQEPCDECCDKFIHHNTI